jgi:hypothetical protein
MVVGVKGVNAVGYGVGGMRVTVGLISTVGGVPKLEQPAISRAMKKRINTTFFRSIHIYLN